MKFGKLMAVVAVVCSVWLAGCGGSTSKSVTFKVDTGDNVKIKVNTTDGYDITSESPFSINKDGVLHSRGIFIDADEYGEYEKIVNQDENATLLDKGVRDGNEYILWSYNNEEWDIAVKIGDSNTAILLGNLVSEESAMECFNVLTVTVE